MVFNISLFYFFWDAAVFSDIASTPYTCILYRVRCYPSYSNSITGNYPSIRKKNCLTRREKNRLVYRSYVLPSVQINPGDMGHFLPLQTRRVIFLFPRQHPKPPRLPHRIPNHIVPRRRNIPLRRIIDLQLVPAENTPNDQEQLAVRQTYIPLACSAGKKEGGSNYLIPKHAREPRENGTRNFSSVRELGASQRSGLNLTGSTKTDTSLCM